MTAQITASLSRNVNHVSPFFDLIGCELTGQFEIHFCWFIAENVLVGEGCLDLAAHKEDHFVFGDWQVADAEFAIRIGAGNLLESASVFGGNMDFSPGNGFLV